MNKVILMGRLTRDVEMMYSQGSEPVAVTKFSVAVNKRFRKEGEPTADFINCVAFGKSAEFIGKYFSKGQQIGIVGRLQVSSYTTQDGQKRYSTDVIVEETYFCGSKGDNNKGDGGNPVYSVDKSVDEDDLPF